MSLLTRVRQRFDAFSKPKAVSLRPDLAGREHIYSSYAGSAEQPMDSYADYATVYSCYAWVRKAVGIIADNIASLPVRVVDANDKELLSHPLSLLLASVNDEDAPAGLWRAYVVNMLLGGETFYQFVPDGRGRPAEIWMRRPDQVGVLPDMARLNYPTAAGYLFTGEDNQTITISPEQMAHDKFYHPLNAWRGLAPIAAIRDGIAIDLFARAYRKLFFRNSARPDFAIIAPNGLTQSEKERFLSDFMRQHQGANKAHLPIILESGATDIKTLSYPAKDIEWLQQMEFSRDEVAAIFGVPDEIMGYGRDTYENFGTALEVLWTLTLLPLIRSRDTTLTRHFRKYNFGLLPGQRIDTDLTGVDVLQEDVAPKIDMAQKLWAMGVPFNKLDEKFGFALGPVDGGDVGFIASGLMPVGSAQPVAEPDSQAADGQGDQANAADAQHPQILGYHIEQGVVSHNEARKTLGFPPRDESEDQRNRTLRTQLELMTMAVGAGIDAESAAELVGLDVTIELPPAPPVMPPVPPNNGDNSQGDAPPQDNAPAKTLYLLPDAAKEGAIRALKKLIQARQDEHLRAIRSGEHWHATALDSGDVERWLGEVADDVLAALYEQVRAITGDHDSVSAAYNALKSDENLSHLLEVEAATPFFLPSGPITHDVYKAMVLRLDPNGNDDAEQQIRMELERRLSRELAQELNNQLDALIPPDATDAQVQAAVNQVAATSGPIRDALRRSLEQSSSLGVSVALDTLQNIGMSFDWTLAHVQASAWASRYSFDLVRGMNQTTQGRLQVAIDEWFRNGDTLEQLRQELAPTFGKRRAAMIASTETTRAAAEGSITGYEQSGVVVGKSWSVANDERVCPVCGGLEGITVPLRADFAPGIANPPAHPSCRCWIRPSIDEVSPR